MNEPRTAGDGDQDARLAAVLALLAGPAALAGTGASDGSTPLRRWRARRAAALARDHDRPAHPAPRAGRAV